MGVFKGFPNLPARLITDFYASHALDAYNIINPQKYLVEEKYIYTDVCSNKVIRHYLATFTGESYPCSQKPLGGSMFTLYLGTLDHLFPPKFLTFSTLALLPNTTET